MSASWVRAHFAGDETDAIQKIRRLQCRASATVSLANQPDKCAVRVVRYQGGAAADEDAWLKAAAKLSSDEVKFTFGALQWRQTDACQLEVCVDVKSEALETLQDTLLSVAQQNEDKSEARAPMCVVIGTTAGRVGPAIRSRLELFWNEEIATLGSIKCDAISVNWGCPVNLGRASAVRRGMAALAAAAPVALFAPLTRARSLMQAAPKPQLAAPPRLCRTTSGDAHPGARAAEAASQASAHVRARRVQLDEDTWAVGFKLSSEHPTLKHRPPTRFHFVLDNSGSMGRQTEEARKCFSELVSVANGPCSLTVFHNEATVLGESFATPAAMRSSALPRQGQTNISGGVKAALDIISRFETSGAAGETETHHVLVLLSDGQHNNGPAPKQALPEMGATLRSKLPALRLSVVVVGVTGNSDTSIGMLLKQSLETVPLPALEPIYFASNMSQRTSVLGQMHTGLASLRGGLLRVASAADSGGIVNLVGQEPAKHVNLLASEHETTLLVKGTPQALLVNGDFVTCVEEDDFDSELAASALEGLMESVRLRRVAGGAESVRGALGQIEAWTAALEKRITETRSKGDGLQLAGAGPRSRVSQHKAAMRALHGTRELRNQLAEIEALSTNNPASQAAFLTGARQKYGAKALRRAAGRPGADAPQEDQLQSLLADLEKTSQRMREALREDLCAKLATLDEESRKALRARLQRELPGSISRVAISDFCVGPSGSGAQVADVAGNADLAKLLDSGLVVRALWETSPHSSTAAPRSYLSMQTAWEQLSEWCDAARDAAGVCHSEYELLMYVGALGHPVEVKRRAATQMNPYAMEVTRVRASPVDSASLCCAMRSSQPVVPPEGGVAIEDVLVMVDPDAPRASRLACFSKLIAETYTSVVLCRDLHMFTGHSMHLALHAHTLFTAMQPVAPTRTASDIEATLRRQFLNRAYQCSECGFGPIDHFACGDLAAHHQESTGPGQVNNSCPKCGWFSDSIEDWTPWNGVVPKEMLTTESVESEAACSEALVDVALRICYSARAQWRPDGAGDAHALLCRLAKQETLTSADGVDHPVQILMALATANEIPEGALTPEAEMALLSEVCARRARDSLKAKVGNDESEVRKEAQRTVACFLGVTRDSAPQTRELDEAEPAQAEVRAACRDDYVFAHSSSLDFEHWVRETLAPWLRALVFVRRLRAAVEGRGGGWPRLAADMERGPAAFADVVAELTKATGDEADLKKALGVEQKDQERFCATMAAQAFLHNSSSDRRCKDAGGSLAEALGDVCAEETLIGLVVDVRMAYYHERVAAKMAEWHRVGTSMVIAKARVADIGQYTHMIGASVHSLNKETFWGLWRAAKKETSGDKVRAFLASANQGFHWAHSPM